MRNGRFIFRLRPPQIDHAGMLHEKLQQDAQHHQRGDHVRQ